MVGLSEPVAEVLLRVLDVLPPLVVEGAPPLVVADVSVPSVVAEGAVVVVWPDEFIEPLVGVGWPTPDGSTDGEEPIYSLVGLLSPTPPVPWVV
jgi:hypothetical protein